VEVDRDGVSCGEWGVGGGVEEVRNVRERIRVGDVGRDDYGVVGELPRSVRVLVLQGV